MGPQPSQNVIQRIRSSYSIFSDKEKRIADYILNNPEKVIHSTINQIAEELSIAEATVFRFCKKLDFQGYQAMKIALASEVVNPIQDIHEMIQEDDDVSTVSEKVFKSNIRAIEDTMSVLPNKKNIGEVVDVLLSANQIGFYGHGGSNVISMDAHHKFFRTGMSTFAYSDSHMQLMSASQLDENDVAVFISHSGTNVDILECLEVAKEHGAKTIAITTFAKTPLSQKADLSLFSVSQETEYRSEALASRIAQLSIIDALYVNVSKELQDKSKESLQKIRKAIALKRL